MASQKAESLNLPVIDVSLLNQKTAEALVSAATKFGFLYIKSAGSGIRADVVDGAFETVCLISRCCQSS